MGIDKEGVKNMKKMGKEEIRKKFMKHTVERMEEVRKRAQAEEGKTEEEDKKKSTNWCFFLFMFGFLAFLIASKMNEETLSLFGMNTKQDQVVG